MRADTLLVKITVKIMTAVITLGISELYMYVFVY